MANCQWLLLILLRILLFIINAIIIATIIISDSAIITIKKVEIDDIIKNLVNIIHKEYIMVFVLIYYKKIRDLCENDLHN